MSRPTGRALQPLAWLGLVLALVAVATPAASRRPPLSPSSGAQLDVADYENNYNRDEFEYYDNVEDDVVYQMRDVETTKPTRLSREFWGAASHLNPTKDPDFEDERRYNRLDYIYDGDDDYGPDNLHDDFVVDQTRDVTVTKPPRDSRDWWGAISYWNPTTKPPTVWAESPLWGDRPDDIYDGDDDYRPDYVHDDSHAIFKAANVGTNLTKIPSWFLPLWGTQPCGNYDNYACGIAIRICKAFFLAPLNSTLMLGEDLAKEDVNQPPSVFMFEPPERVDIARLNKDGYEYKPTLVAKIGTEQGLFWAQKRDPASRYDVFNRYPLLRVPLINDSSFPPRDCVMLTLGGGEGGQAAEGAATPVRRWVSVKLRRISCQSNRRLCVFELVGNSSTSEPAQVCTKVGDLGAPILCNNQDLGSTKPKTVHYQVVRLPDGSESCSTQVVAHSLNALIGELRGLLATNLRDETGFIREYRPTPGYVTFPNEFPKSCGLRETSAEFKPTTKRPNRDVVFPTRRRTTRDPSIKG